MSLAAPAFVFTLLLIPLGFGAARLARNRRRRYALRFPATATVASSPGSLTPTRGWAPVLR